MEIKIPSIIPPIKRRGITMKIKILRELMRLLKRLFLSFLIENVNIIYVKNIMNERNDSMLVSIDGVDSIEGLLA